MENYTTNQDLTDIFSNQKIKALIGHNEFYNSEKDYSLAKHPLPNMKEEQAIEKVQTIDQKIKWLKQNGWLGWLVSPQIYVFDYDCENGDELAKELGKIIVNYLLEKYPTLPIIKTPRGWQFIFSIKDEVTQAQGKKETKPICPIFLRHDSRTNPSRGYLVLPTNNTSNRHWIRKPTKEQLENPLKYLPHLPNTLRMVKFSSHEKDRVNFSIESIIGDGDRHQSLLKACSTLYGASQKNNPWLTDEVIKEAIYFIWQNFLSKNGREITQDEVDNIIRDAKNYHPNRETQRKLSQSERLANYALKQFIFFKDHGDNFFAETKQGDIYPLESKAFFLVVTKLLEEIEGSLASRDTARDAVHKIEASIFNNSPTHQTYLRSAYNSSNDEIYVWLGKGRILWITPKEWKIVTSIQNIKFLATSNMLELPNPLKLDKQDAYVESLKALLNLFPNSCHSPISKIRLLLAYIVTGWLGHSPRPILMLTGEQGSCKSTVSTMIKNLIDPCRATFVNYKTNEDFLVQASNSQFLVFDNVSRLGNDTIDAICRLCTGDSQLSRKRFTDKDTQIFADMNRSLIFNGIVQPSEQADFLDRAFILELNRVNDEDRQEIEQLKQDFTELRPEVLGAIAGFLVEMLRNKKSLDSLNIPLPRLADWSKWAMAFYCSFYHNLNAYQYFLDDWKEIVDKQDNIIFDSDPVIHRLKEFIQFKKEFIGTSQDLFEILHTKPIDLDASNTNGLSDRMLSFPIDRSFPNTSTKLRQRITKIKSQLEKLNIGIDLDYRVKTAYTKHSRALRIWLKVPIEKELIQSENLQIENQHIN